MRLTVNCRLKRGDTFLLRIDNQEQAIDFEHPSVSFSFPAPGTYTLEAYQNPAPQKRLRRAIPLLLLTLLPRGILYALSSYTVSEPWHCGILPCTFRATHPLHLEADTALHLFYQRPVLSPETGKCAPPALHINGVPVPLSFSANPHDFFTQYWHRAQGLISIYSLCLLILGTILYGGIKSQNLSAILICAAVLLALALVIFLVLQKEYKQMKALRALPLQTREAELP